jgi:hypothetical protein
LLVLFHGLQGCHGAGNYQASAGVMQTVPKGTMTFVKLTKLYIRKSMNKKIKLALIVSSVALLSACGGGSDGGTTNVDPQGYWTGPASTGYTVNTAILENGETWGVYTSGSTIYGALYGSTSVSGNNVKIIGTNFNFLTNSSSQGNLTGTIVAKSSMSLSGSGVTVPLTYNSSYDTAATSAAITGTWSFTGRSGSYTLIPGTITVDSAGRFTLNQTNCVTTGSIIPRSTGKNIYNVNLTGSGVGCAVGQSSMSGIAYLDTTVKPNKFLSLALTSSKNDGVIVIGTKQ